MAGEWLMYDVCLPQKPEVLELVDRTGLDADQVVGRMLMLWGWASLNCEEGQARISIRLLSRVVGGDEGFWQAVQSVGWLEVDAEAGTVAIPGWDRRFSNAAKSRAMASCRAEKQRASAPKRTTPCAQAHAPVRSSAPKRRDRGDRNSSSSPGGAALMPEAPDGPQDATQPDDLPGWDALRKAWGNGLGRPWNLPHAPDKAADRLSEPGWFEKALEAIKALPRCRYFRDPVTLPQLVAEGFVDKVLGGQFDNPRDHRPGPRGQDDRPPPQAWTGDDAARFEATKRAMADRIRQEGAV
jgi:hypothetical protein